jgi:zeta-carotene desaturase
MLVQTDASHLTRARVYSNPQVPEGQKLKVGIVGGGLAGMVTAMDLSEAGHDVEIFEVRCCFIHPSFEPFMDKGV